MITLVYVSAARPIMSEQPLSDLLAVCRLNNAERNVTGMLCYADGNFMQAIEGEEDAIDTLEETIKRDTRHIEMRRMVREPIAMRQFNDWSMALRRINDLPAEDRYGCVSLMNASLSGMTPDSPTVTFHMLNSFRKSMR